MTDDQDAPLYPVIGYTVGVVDGAVALRIEYATTRAEYAVGAGAIQQFVLSPDAAAEVGAALAERAGVARTGAN